MGKASQAKKVNRAAATGGGRTAGKKTPVGWYARCSSSWSSGVLGVFIASKSLNDSQGERGGAAARRQQGPLARRLRLQPVRRVGRAAQPTAAG